MNCTIRGFPVMLVRRSTAVERPAEGAATCTAEQARQTQALIQEVAIAMVNGRMGVLKDLGPKLASLPPACLHQHERAMSADQMRRDLEQIAKRVEDVERLQEAEFDALKADVMSRASKLGIKVQFK